MLLWDNHTLTLKYVPGESNILPTINGRQKKKWREIKKNSRRGDHRLGARPRERKKKPGECVLRNKTVFSFTSSERDRPDKEGKPVTWGLKPPPRLRSPSHSSLLPAVSCFHSSHLLYLPLPPPTNGSHLDIISISLIPRSNCEQRGRDSHFFYDQQEVQMAPM